MSYQPIFDGEFDIVFELEQYQTNTNLLNLIEDITARGMFVTKFLAKGPAGHPTIKMRGTRKQLLSWISECYDVDRVGAGPDDGDMMDDHVFWASYVDAGIVTFVA